MENAGEVIPMKRPTHSRRPSELLKTVKTLKPGDSHFVACTPETEKRQMQLAWAMASRLRKRYGTRIRLKRTEGGFNMNLSNAVRAPKVKYLDRELKIEKGIPIPSPLRGSNGYKGAFPLEQLKVGDSFLVFCQKKRVKPTQHQLNSAIKGWVKRHKGFKGTTRRVSKGIRLWRIA